MRRRFTWEVSLGGLPTTQSNTHTRSSIKHTCFHKECNTPRSQDRRYELQWLFQATSVGLVTLVNLLLFLSTPNILLPITYTVISARPPAYEPPKENENDWWNLHCGQEKSSQPWETHNLSRKIHSVHSALQQSISLARDFYSHHEYSAEQLRFPMKRKLLPFHTGTAMSLSER